MSNGNNAIIVFREPENSRLKQWVNQSVKNNQFLLWVFKMYFNFFETIEQIIEFTSLKLNILIVGLILLLTAGISWNLGSYNSQQVSQASQVFQSAQISPKINNSTNNSIFLSCVNDSSAKILESESTIASYSQAFNKTPNQDEIISFFSLLERQISDINLNYQKLQTCNLEDANYQNLVLNQIQTANTALINIRLINQHIKDGNKVEYIRELTELQINLTNLKLANISSSLTNSNQF